jgi:drug/metabolite transporter (DMT)-like permease
MEHERPPARGSTGLRASRLGVVAVAIPVVGFSLANLIVKVVSVHPATFAFWRLWVGAAIMVAVTAIARRPVNGAVLRAGIPAGVLFGLNIVFFFAALRETAVADVLVISALQPALTVLVAGRLFGEHVTRRELGFVLASVAGVVIFVIGSSGTPAWSLRGDLLAVASLAVFFVYFLWSKRVRSTTGIGSIEYMATVTVVAAVVVSPIALFGPGIGGMESSDWLWLALFVAVAQGGHLLLTWAHRHVDVTVSSLLLLGEPPISAAAAWIFLGEPVTWLGGVGAAIALVSVAAVVRSATSSGVAAGVQDAAAPP